MNEVSFSELQDTDLIVDTVYQSDRDAPRGALSGEPITKLLRVGNLGGFRSRKGTAGIIYSALTSTGAEPEWPDRLDKSAGVYKYFGDNRVPGNDLHATKQKGNQLLRDSFELAKSGNAAGRLRCPVFFIFEPGEIGRDQIFRGLAVPASSSEKGGEALAVVSRTKDGDTFQNYEATFALLGNQIISGDWVRDCVDAGELLLEHQLAPSEWKTWVETGQIFLESNTQKNLDSSLPSHGEPSRIFLKLVSTMKQVEDFESCVRKGRGFSIIENHLREGEKGLLERHRSGSRIRLLRLDAESTGSGIELWTEIRAGDRVVHLLPNGELADSRILEKIINEDVAKALGNSTTLNQLGLLLVLSEPRSSHHTAEVVESLSRVAKNSSVGFESISRRDFDEILKEVDTEAKGALQNLPPAISAEWDQLLETADQYRPQVHRPEQRLLRKLLFADSAQGACALCATDFPTEFLVTAHIKRRTEASEQERGDREIVMPVCRFGCDELFERGYVSVSDEGEFSLQHMPSATPAVAAYIGEHFAGKRCWWWDQHPGSRIYFAFHHSSAQD